MPRGLVTYETIFSSRCQFGARQYRLCGGHKQIIRAVGGEEAPTDKLNCAQQRRVRHRGSINFKE
jgi:hypothetical protein